MNLNEIKIYINGRPVRYFYTLPDNRSKNQKKRDRKEWFKNKRKQFKGLSFKITLEDEI